MPVVPNLFDWIVTDQVGACVNPRALPAVADELRSRQIRVVVNLHERSSADLLEPLGIRELHLPVADLTAPSQTQLDDGVRCMTRALAAGERVAVHCGAGLGRTGTLLAAYLVSKGETAEAAIARVRAARPGSIETAEQEAAVDAFARRHRVG